MRKKIAVSVGLVVVALLVTILVAWLMPQPPTEPQLRVGMTWEEVEREVGCKPFLCEGGLYSQNVVYVSEDVMGNGQSTLVHYSDGHVTEWEPRRFHSTRPPWLDKAMKRAGW